MLGNYNGKDKRILREWKGENRVKPKISLSKVNF